MNIQLNKENIFKSILGVNNITDLANTIREYSEHRRNYMDDNILAIQEIERQANKIKKLDKNDKINSFSRMAALAISRDALELTPVKTGKLRNSMYMYAVGQGFKIGYDCEYATHVHEIPFYNHEHPTQYKFLEDAAQNVYNNYLKEYGIDLDINILYSPLSIYINVKNAPGEKLNVVKAREQYNKSDIAYKQLAEHVDALDTDDISPEDEPYYIALYNFIIWWEGMHEKSHEDVLKAWLDRTRHKLANKGYRNQWHW